MSIKSTLIRWLIKPSKSWLQKRLNAWLAKRIPKAKQQQINYRNIFIMPTRFGTAFCIFTFLLFLLGTNYQNNIIILISYLLVSFFIVVLHHSFFNLSGLTFIARMSISGFAGKRLLFPLTIVSSKQRFNIQLSFQQESDSQYSENVPIIQPGENEILVPYKAITRGQYALTRILITSEYGFGLFRTWTRLDFAQRVTVFPKPITYAWHQQQNAATATELNEAVESHRDSLQIGHDEFYQLQQYRQGEPFSRVAWKQVARGQGWLSKQFQQTLSNKLQLDFDSLPDSTLEQKLSLLSYAVNDCYQQQISFSLKLPNQEFAYDSSPEHTTRCLTALACY